MWAASNLKTKSQYSIRAPPSACEFRRTQDDRDAYLALSKYQFAAEDKMDLDQVYQTVFFGFGF